MLWIVVAALVTTGCGASAGTEASSPAAASDQPAPADWKVVDEQEGNFSVLLPTNAQRETNTNEGVKTIAWVGTGSDGSVYMAGSFLAAGPLAGTKSSDLESRAEAFATGMLQEGCKGKVEGVKRGTVNGRDAAKFVGECQNGMAALGFLRLHEGRFYSSTALLRSKAAAEEFERFINSLEVHGE